MTLSLFYCGLKLILVKKKTFTYVGIARTCLCQKNQAALYFCVDTEY